MAAFALNLKTDRRSREISGLIHSRSCASSIYSQSRAHRFFRNAACRNFIADLGDYKQRDATVRTRGFDGAGR